MPSTWQASCRNAMAGIAIAQRPRCGISNVRFLPNTSTDNHRRLWSANAKGPALPALSFLSHGYSARRIGDEAIRERTRLRVRIALVVRARQHAHRDEVVDIVITQLGDLCWPVARADETGAADRRPFALAVTGADALLRHAAVGRVGRRLGGSRRARLGRVAFARGAVRLVAGATFACDGWASWIVVAGRARFAEHGDADHADVVRTPGARGVTVGQVGEHEL